MKPDYEMTTQEFPDGDWHYVWRDGELVGTFPSAAEALRRYPQLNHDKQ